MSSNIEDELCLKLDNIKITESSPQIPSPIFDMLLNFIKKGNSEKFISHFGMLENKEQKDKGGYTLLWSCCLTVPIDFKILQTIINGGCNFEDVNKHKQTVLIFASECNFTKLALYLLSIGANPNAQDAVGYTALHYAVFNRNIELAKTLIIKYNASPYLTTDDNWTPIHLFFSGMCSQFVLKLHHEEFYSLFQPFIENIKGLKKIIEDYAV